MKAAVFYGRHDLRVEDRPRPTIGAGDVLIRVAFCGICGSDLHTYDGLSTSIHRRPPGPRVLGHEVSGIVAEVGAAVTTCNVGDRVTCIPWVTCGVCPYCRRGLVNHCPRKTLISGAMADYAVAPHGAVYHIPDNVSLERAALSEPLSCCLWAIDLAGMQSGATVVVVGAGTMGLLLLLLAHRSGAAQTVVCEPNDTRRELAMRLGATRTVDPRSEDLRQIIGALTEGIGADAAFEAVGHPATTLAAMQSVRNAGTVVIVGVADSSATMSLAPFEVYQRELTIRGSFTRRWSFDRAMLWLAVLDLDPLLSRVFPLDDVQEAFAWAKAGRGAKILVSPSA